MTEAAKAVRSTWEEVPSAGVSGAVPAASSVEQLTLETLLYGLASGLSGCGFYDLVKAVAALFMKKDE